MSTKKVCLINKIVKYHLNHATEVGTTLCLKCHDDIDNFYYKRKDEDKKN